ncbi:MAG: DUF4147 domain-containing protein [Gammaproteobacteria bacterium]|nr:DUF4147 domain-containing protein [Gammaproteobacteria bacterium]
MSSDPKTARNVLLACFQAALKAVNGSYCVKKYFRDIPKPWSGPMAMIAIGKAAPSMAEGARAVFGEQIQSGLIICRAPCAEAASFNWPGGRLIESSHPVPDKRSIHAGQAMIDFIQALPDDMPVLFLISGGTSALVELLPENVQLEDLQRINEIMLANGMPIDAMNWVRKAVSLIKGGRLIQYLGERPVLNLLLSDVPEDDPAVIGSGLLVPPEPEQQEFAGLPPDVEKFINTIDNPHPEALTHSTIETIIIGNNQMAGEAAAQEAARLGFTTTLHESFLCDEVEKIADQLTQHMKDADKGIHIWGAEPLVFLPDSPGRGGRNQHLALLLAEKNKANKDIYYLVGATDGSDGVTEDAGALVDGQTVQRGEEEGLDVNTCIKRADAGTFLEASGDLISTGSTGSNVMDLIIVCKT